MDKAKLLEFGLTEEQATKVLEGLDGAYVPKSRFNEVNAELKSAKDSLKERDTQLEALKGADGAKEALKTQIAELQEANRKKAEEYAAELKKVKRDSLDEQLLMGAKAKSVIAAKAHLPKIDDAADDDTYKSIRTEQIKMLASAEATSFLFGDGKTTLTGASPAEGKGADTGAGFKNPFSKENWNVTEQGKLFKENREQAIALAKAAGVDFL